MKSTMYNISKMNIKNIRVSKGFVALTTLSPILV